MVKFKGLLALKSWVIISFIIIWNIIFGIAVTLNGGFGEITNPAARYVASIALFGTVILSLFIIYHIPFRERLLCEDRKNLYDSSVYIFLCVLCGFLGVMILAGV